MKLRVLALDYDGTIAENGVLDPDVRDAIGEARKRGLVVILVTGRIVSDLRASLGDMHLFDAVVAENGAVLTYPRVGRSTRLAPGCSAALLEALRARGVDARAGNCVVELDAAAAHAALDAIAALQLPLVMLFNRGRLMILPQAISKATGLREALRTMRLSLHNAIGVGDGENDHELLLACEHGAAVAWGSPALRAAADTVIEGAGPTAVAAYVRSACASPHIPMSQSTRRNVVLGRDADGGVVSLALSGRNILIAGDPRSGKSWIGGLLCEQLVLQGYCICLLDPEGDYAILESLPGVVLLGGADSPPTMHELVRILRHADVSVIVDLSQLQVPEKERYVFRALATLAELRRSTGLPHRIVVDEAHYFMRESKSAPALDLELGGYMMVTYRVSGLRQDLLTATECVVVTHETDPAEVRLLHEKWCGTESLAELEEALRGLELDEAVLLPERKESATGLRRFRLAPRVTHHVRHRHKYLDAPVTPELGFRFVFDDGTLGPLVCSLQELVDRLAGLPLEQLAGHVLRRDLSRWIEDVFHDITLAARVREFEERHGFGTLPDFNGAVEHAIRERYHVSGRSA